MNGQGKELPAVKHAAEALSRALGEGTQKTENKKPPPANAGRGEGRRSLRKIPRRRTEEYGNISEPGAL